MYVLLNKAQRDFHDMFTRTYGVMYQRNAEVFQNYFKDLKLYYDKGILNPVDSTNSFFNALYQKMFQVTLKTGDSIFLFCRKYLAQIVEKYFTLIFVSSRIAFGY